MFPDIGLHPTLDDQPTVFYRSIVDIQAVGADAKPIEFISRPERFSRFVFWVSDLRGSQWQTASAEKEAPTDVRIGARTARRPQRNFHLHLS